MKLFRPTGVLLPVSPCIDKGTNDVEIFGLPDLDFMNNPRINNNVVDIGAVENQAGLPEIQEQPVGGIFCSGDKHDIYVSVGDTALYQWYKDGEEIPGAQQKILSPWIVLHFSRKAITTA